MDVADCAKRYVCEISATPPHLLTDQDRSTLTMFGESLRKSKTTSAKYEYDLAWALGATSRDLEQCKSKYSNCPVDGIAKIVGRKNHF